MKNFLLLIFSFTSLLYSQNIKVTDYDVPISTAQTLRFDGSWNWSQTGNDVTANNANANLFYRIFYSSLPIAWFINVDATGSKSFSDYAHNVLFDGSFRKYIWDDKDVFGFTRLVAQHSNTYDNISTDLTVGFGYGRFIKATALAKAVRIEDHLLKDGILTTNLPKQTMINIAHIIEREGEYHNKYGEIYEQQWFDDIENEISKTDVLKEGNMGSIGILRMRQVLFNINERVNDRYYGWDFSAGVLFPITSPIDTIPAGNPNLTLIGNYSFPINWQLQINSTAEIFTPLDSLGFKQFNARLGIDFIYELSNRINFVTSYRLGFFKPAEGNSLQEHNLSASFWYYLENNIYFTSTLDFSKSGNAPRIFTTRVGLQYNVF